MKPFLEPVMNQIKHGLQMRGYVATYQRQIPNILLHELLARRTRLQKSRCSNVLECWRPLSDRI